MKNKKIVYVAFSADILHEGHINILKHAAKFGKVIVGLLSDQAFASYRQLPHLNYKQREIVLKNIKFVDSVIVQKTLDYSENLRLIKPDFVVHGDDWKIGLQKTTRKKVINSLKKWSGKLIEIPYTKNISSSQIKDKFLKIGTSPDKRKSKLVRFMDAKKIIRILESHSALTGLIIENLKIIKNNKFFDFDGMWSSSLTDSALRGKPDNQSVDYSTRIAGLNEILEVTTKPIIFDADNGGRLEHLPFMIKSLERNGVSAAIIEDKIGLKKNSLFKNQKGAQQDTIKEFCKKIIKAKETRISDDFLIIILPLSASTTSEKVRTILSFIPTLDAPSEGEAEDNVGAVLISSKLVVKVYSWILSSVYPCIKSFEPSELNSIVNGWLSCDVTDKLPLCVTPELRSNAVSNVNSAIWSFVPLITYIFVPSVLKSTSLGLWAVDVTLNAPGVPAVSIS